MPKLYLITLNKRYFFVTYVSCDVCLTVDVVQPRGTTDGRREKSADTLAECPSLVETHPRQLHSVRLLGRLWLPHLLHDGQDDGSGYYSKHKIKHSNKYK